MTTRESTPNDAAFDVPEDVEVHVCPVCTRPFATPRQRDLHLGEVHEGSLDSAQRSAYEDATDAERDELWLYHFKAVLALLVIYMATGLLYLIVLSG